MKCLIRQCKLKPEKFWWIFECMAVMFKLIYFPFQWWFLPFDSTCGLNNADYNSHDSSAYREYFTCCNAGLSKNEFDCTHSSYINNVLKLLKWSISCLIILLLSQAVHFVRLVIDAVLPMSTHCIDFLWWCGSWCAHLFSGGNGYINDYPTGRFLRDAKLYEIGAGTSEVRRLIIGRAFNAMFK